MSWGKYIITLKSRSKWSILSNELRDTHSRIYTELKDFLKKYGLRITYSISLMKERFPINTVVNTVMPIKRARKLKEEDISF